MLQTFDSGSIPILKGKIHSKTQFNEFMVLKYKNCIGDIAAKYYVDNLLFSKGCFIGTGDTLETEVNQVNPVTYTTVVKKSKYFDALKNGKWLYYSKNGQIIKTEKWNKGNIMETHVFWNIKDSSQYYITQIDSITYETKKVKNKYFELIKESLIFYYNDKKKLIRTEKWNNGVLEESKLYE